MQWFALCTQRTLHFYDISYYSILIRRQTWNQRRSSDSTTTNKAIKWEKVDNIKGSTGDAKCLHHCNLHQAANKTQTKTKTTQHQRYLRPATTAAVTATHPTVQQNITAVQSDHPSRHTGKKRRHELLRNPGQVHHLQLGHRERSKKQKSQILDENSFLACSSLWLGREPVTQNTNKNKQHNQSHKPHTHTWVRSIWSRDFSVYSWSFSVFFSNISWWCSNSCFSTEPSFRK